MRGSKWATVLFGVGFVLLAGLAFAQQDVEKTKGEDETSQREPVPELKSLERAVSTRPSPVGREASGSYYSNIYKAANDFARAVAGDDDETYTRLASAALQEAVAAKSGRTRGIQSLEMATAAMAPARPPGRALGGGQVDFESSVWEQSDFQKNFRKLLELAAKPGSGISPLLGPTTSPGLHIVGPGTRLATDKEFRDCVSVGIQVGTGNQFCCTGTLVGKNVVVTAGHCFFCAGGGASGASIAYVGTDISKPGTVIKGKITRHPKYSQGGLHNDLSVIVLESDVPETVAKPRRIATKAEIDNATFVRAVGFGNSDFQSTTGFGIKRLVDIPVASISCSRTNDSTKYGCDKKLELVAGFLSLGSDTCNGDSGGPIYVLTGDEDASKDENWAIAGATSRATSTAARPCGDGGIYPRLDQYLEFIKKIPGGHF